MLEYLESATCPTEMFYKKWRKKELSYAQKINKARYETKISPKYLNCKKKAIRSKKDVEVRKSKAMEHQFNYLGNRITRSYLPE